MERSVKRDSANIVLQPVEMSPEFRSLAAAYVAVVLEIGSVSMLPTSFHERPRIRNAQL